MVGRRLTRALSRALLRLVVLLKTVDFDGKSRIYAWGARRTNKAHTKTRAQVNLDNF